ncbi:MAG TPA: PqqD family protein [Gemmatimonadales bacterium]|nr:PqqD family protein [Gemmatimonadales bacterium]
MTIAADTLHQIVGGEAVLLELTRQCYYSLDEVGSRIWALLEQGHTPESIVAQLLSEYDTTEAVLRHDLQALLNQLADAGLVRVEA